MHEPAEYADDIERGATLPAGSGERFSGYGVMGLPFRSGHTESSARLEGADLGVMGPAPEQAQLSDFAIPQRGVFVVGLAFFP